MVQGIIFQQNSHPSLLVFVSAVFTIIHTTSPQLPRNMTSVESDPVAKEHIDLLPPRPWDSFIYCTCARWSSPEFSTPFSARCGAHRTCSGNRQDAHRVGSSDQERLLFHVIPRWIRSRRRRRPVTLRSSTVRGRSLQRGREGVLRGVPAQPAVLRDLWVWREGHARAPAHVGGFPPLREYHPHGCEGLCRDYLGGPDEPWTMGRTSPRTAGGSCSVSRRTSQLGVDRARRRVLVGPRGTWPCALLECTGFVLRWGLGGPRY